MYRRPLSRLFQVCLGLATLLIGCQPLPVSKGPEFGWSAAESLRESLPQHQIPLKFIDARPDWERTYRRPAERPEEFRFAIGFVPIENLSPPVGDSMTRSIQVAAAELGKDGGFGDLTLHSFQVIINERNAREAEYRRLYPPEPRAGLSIEFSDSVELTIGAGGIGRDRRRRHGHHVPPGVPEPALSPAILIENGHRVPVGPPRELGGEYSEGVTCSITATLRLFPPGAAERNLEINAHGFVPPSQAGSQARETSVREAVDAALSDFQRQVAAGLQRPLPASPTSQRKEPPNLAPEPQLAPGPALPAPTPRLESR